METTAFPPIGSIVVLHSHPYKQDVQNVLISGDSQLLSPLMVVIETLEETKDQHDERTGLLQTKKGSAQCKCIWFSGKTHLFEEQWINSELLVIIDSNEITSINYDEIYLGQRLL